MTEKLPQTLEVPLSSLAELAVEWWRLERSTAGGPDVSASHARHVARRLGRFLGERELTVLDITGRRYEPGLAVEVLDVVGGAAGAAAGTEVIEEMVSPIVLWRGTVVRHGQVIVRKS